MVAGVVVGGMVVVVLGLGWIGLSEVSLEEEEGLGMVSVFGLAFVSVIVVGFPSDDDDVSGSPPGVVCSLSSRSL